MSKVFLTLFTGLYFFIAPFIAESAESWRDFNLTPENTKLTFLIGSIAHDINGKAVDFKGVLRVPDDLKGENYHTTVTIPVSSLVTGMDNRDEKMHNFSMEMDKFPDIIFTATQFKNMPEPIVPGKDFNFTMIGNITIKGISKQIILPTVVKAEDDHFVATSKVGMQWRPFNIIDPKFLFFTIHKNFEVQLELKLPYSVLEKKGTSATNALVEETAEKVPTTSSEEFAGSCMLIPEIMNPKQLKKAGQRAGISWDWGCQSIFHNIDGVEYARLSNMKRIFGWNTINVDYRCIRKDGSKWKCKEIKGTAFKKDKEKD